MRAATAVAAAAAVAGGWSAARPAHATGSAAAARRAVTMAAPPGICSKNPSGQLVSCPAPLRPALLPAGARDHATVTQPVRSPATMVDTRTWTSGGGNTYPGANAPFGMIQWSPDTMPDRSDGGGYTYGDKQLTGYSLTHLSGPGCQSAGDVPILPMTGNLPAGNPSAVTTSFTNAGEVAQAGFYAAKNSLPHTITSQFTATPHAAFGKFTFPRTTAADILIKLRDSERYDAGSGVRVIGNTEVAGSVVTGHFCNEPDSYGPQDYTLYFDIVFDHPFSSARIITEPRQTDPNSVFLRFNTTRTAVLRAKVAISYVSTANARLNWEKEIPGWNFDLVQGTAQSAWNSLLSSIEVSGGSFAQTQEFYSLLYKDFLQPNVTSDVNGQFLGSDQKVHTLSAGQANQYGMFSNWDTYHSLAQLQAILDPTAASDMAQSLLNYYAENRILPQWGYLSLDSYAMVGDPGDALISDYYAFGATNFNTAQALADMMRQATTVNRVRPGEALEARYGYLPEDASYGCCRPHGYVSSLLEYDTADFALSRFAAALGDTADAAMLEKRANNWINIFDRKDQLLTPRLKNGRFLTSIRATTTRHYVEGDAYEYLWDVPNNYAGLFSRLGGDAKVVPELRRYFSQPDGQGVYAHLANEFDLGEQFAADYAHSPATTQEVVSTIRDDLCRPGPDGLLNNDDLGAESSQFIWEMLGMYPENPGSDNVVFASPGFPDVVINLPSGKTITISAHGASPTTFYVSSLTINGTAYDKLDVPFGTLAQGATMDWTLTRKPTSWASAPQDAPPSYRA